MKLFNFTVACLVLICIAFGLSSCSSAPGLAENQRGTSLTPGQVSMTLKKGTTTKAEVLNTFGAPNIVTQDSEGHSVWTYQRNATVTRSGGDSFYWNVIFLGGTKGDSGMTNSTSTMTLIITFDDKDIVSNFKSLATNF